MTTGKKTPSRRKAKTTASSESDVIKFVIQEGDDGVFNFVKAESHHEVEEIYSTADDSPMDTLEDLLEIRADALLNAHCAFSLSANWYSEALNPKYKAPRQGELKFKHHFSVAKLLDWLDAEGNTFIWDKYIGGKPQLKDPSSLGKRKKKTAKTIVRRRR